MPPLGPLYGIDVYVDEHLAQAESIAFRAGTHGELIQMAYADFKRIAAPHVLALAYHR
jgi:Ala-tRNA(Pro) deacylase